MKPLPTLGEVREDVRTEFDSEYEGKKPNRAERKGIMASKKGDCGKKPRVGKKGDPKPSKSGGRGRGMGRKR